jgi:hypothetical protein
MDGINEIFLTGDSNLRMAGGRSEGAERIDVMRREEEDVSLLFPRD